MIAAFPLNPNGERVPTTYVVDPPKYDVTTHQFSDHIETNLESDMAEYRCHLYYQILYPIEAKILDDHYAAAKQSDDFEFTGQDGITHSGAQYLDYKRERDGTIERRRITIIYWG